MASQDWFEKDFYATLGVPQDADAAAVKKAYRKLARDLHPDHNVGDARAEEGEHHPDDGRSPVDVGGEERGVTDFVSSVFKSSEAESHLKSLLKNREFTDLQYDDVTAVGAKLATNRYGPQSSEGKNVWEFFRSKRKDYEIMILIDNIGEPRWRKSLIKVWLSHGVSIEKVQKWEKKLGGDSTWAAEYEVAYNRKFN